MKKLIKEFLENGIVVYEKEGKMYRTVTYTSLDGKEFTKDICLDEEKNQNTDFAGY